MIHQDLYIHIVSPCNRRYIWKWNHEFSILLETVHHFNENPKFKSINFHLLAVIEQRIANFYSKASSVVETVVCCIGGWAFIRWKCDVWPWRWCRWPWSRRWSTRTGFCKRKKKQTIFSDWFILQYITKLIFSWKLGNIHIYRFIPDQIPIICLK